MLGQRCPACHKVYVPPRSACPADGTPTAEEIELPDKGTVTTFCIVNVPFMGQKITPPYVSAYVLLDGADIAFLHLILDIPAEEVRMGMRVEAVWKPREEWGTTIENISHFRRPASPTRTTRPTSSTSEEEQTMRDVAVVGFAQRQMEEFDGSPTCVELLVPLFEECYEQTGWTRRDIGFWCSGSSDYLAGRSFSFVSAVDAIGVIPPVNESHVEMDAAWALYEAWVKIQTGEVDTALVYGFGKSSAGVLRRTLALQLDPYTMTPLWPDTVSLAGLQARAGIDAGLWDERAMAEVVQPLAHRRREERARHPQGRLVGRRAARPADVRRPAAQARLRARHRRRRRDRARRRRQGPRGLANDPAWITSLSTYVDPISMGTRDLTRSPSTALAAARRPTSTAWRWPSCTRRSATRS